MATAEATSRVCRRVLMFPVPFQGHLKPMLQLAGALHSRGGLSITVLHAAFNAPDPAAPTRRTTASSPSARARPPATSSPPARTRTSPQCSCASTSACRRRSGRASARCSPRTAASRRRRAWCSTPTCAGCRWWRRSSACRRSCCAPAPPPASSRTWRSRSSATRAGPPTAAFSRYQALLDMPLNELTPLRHSSGVVINTIQDLESSELQTITNGLGVPIYAIGPLHKISPVTEDSLIAQDQTCLQWLDKQEAKSVIYVSFGAWHLWMRRNCWR
ncbi:hypothetical protein ACP4OV_006937 [Aristida adscensionis]